MADLNYDWGVAFKAEGHEGLIRVSAPDEAGARAHVNALHPHDLMQHSKMDPGDAFAVFGNKVSNPNAPDAPVLRGRGLRTLEITSVTRVVPAYLAALKAEIARHEK